MEGVAEDVAPYLAQVLAEGNLPVIQLRDEVDRLMDVREEAACERTFIAFSGRSSSFASFRLAQSLRDAASPLLRVRDDIDSRT